MSHGNLLQGHFLDALCAKQVPVAIFLVNGIKLHGVIDGYDEYVILLKNTITQLVFKHAISTVVPSKVIDTSGKDKIN